MSQGKKSIQKQEQDQIRENHNLRKMQGLKNKLQLEKEDAAKSFCQHLRYLMNCLYLKNKNDDNILQMQERVRIASTTNPITVIETAGPYFYKYRTQLARRNMDFFKVQDFTGDVEEAAKTSEAQVDVSNTPEVITTMRNTWDQFMPAEHNVILQKAIEMLGFVAGYTKADRALKTLKERQNAKNKK